MQIVSLSKTIALLLIPWSMNPFVVWRNIGVSFPSRLGVEAAEPGDLRGGRIKYCHLFIVSSSQNFLESVFSLKFKILQNNKSFFIDSKK